MGKQLFHRINRILWRDYRYCDRISRVRLLANLLLWSDYFCNNRCNRWWCNECCQLGYLLRRQNVSRSYQWDRQHGVLVCTDQLYLRWPGRKQSVQSYNSKDAGIVGSRHCEYNIKQRWDILVNLWTSRRMGNTSDNTRTKWRYWWCEWNRLKTHIPSLALDANSLESDLQSGW